MASPLILPNPIQAPIERLMQDFLTPEGMPRIDFARPAGAEALVSADSVSWRLFKNPVSLFIGGVAAVILELAEARVRAGVWDHTSFRTDPVTRLRRTGLAAMVTVYAPREVATGMIAGVNRAHARVTGLADDGRPYRADDPELLDWVQATASWGFIEAFHRYVRPLSDVDRDQAWAEGAEAARLYGAVGAPTTEAEWQTELAAMTPRLTPSPVMDEYLSIIRKAPAIPSPGGPLQRLLVRAGVDMVPEGVTLQIGLDAGAGLNRTQARLVRLIAGQADRLVLRSAPAAHASIRMGHPTDWLYR